MCLFELVKLYSRAMASEPGWLLKTATVDRLYLVTQYKDVILPWELGLGPSVLSPGL